MYRARRILTGSIWLLESVCGSAFAATLQVQVQDGSGRPLPEAVVFLESREQRLVFKPVPDAEISQRNRQFEPRVLVVPVGSSVSFPNLDTVRHHVYSFSSAKTFELKLYAGRDANPVLFDRVGIAVLGCNIHDNMAAWVVVVDTPHYGRTAASGSVVLSNVPPGNYRLRVWHPALPVGAAATDQPLVVGAGDSTASVRLSGLAP